MTFLHLKGDTSMQVVLNLQPALQKVPRDWSSPFHMSQHPHSYTIKIQVLGSQLIFMTVSSILE